MYGILLASPLVKFLHCQCNQVDCVTAEKTWAKLEEALTQINNLNASGLSFEELYRLFSESGFCSGQLFVSQCCL